MLQKFYFQNFTSQQTQKIRTINIVYSIKQRPKKCLKLFSNANWIHSGTFFNSFLFSNRSNQFVLLLRNYIIQETFPFSAKAKHFSENALKNAVSSQIYVYGSTGKKMNGHPETTISYNSRCKYLLERKNKCSARNHLSNQS